MTLTAPHIKVQCSSKSYCELLSYCCFVSSFNCSFEKVKLKFVDVEKICYFVLEFSLTKDIQVASFCCGYCFFSDCQHDQYHTCLAS